MICARVRPMSIGCSTDRQDVFKVTVHGGGAPHHVVPLLSPNYWRALFCIGRGFSDADALLGCDENGNVASRVIEQSLTATGEPFALKLLGCAATWLLAVMHAQVPLTVIFKRCRVEVCRPSPTSSRICPRRTRRISHSFARVLADEIADEV